MHTTPEADQLGLEEKRVQVTYASMYRDLLPLAENGT